MSEAPRCPKCGAPLSNDSPAGLCPKCLVLAGFESEAGPNSAAEASGSAAQPTLKSPAGSGGRFEPPPPEKLSPLFPQLEILGLLGKGGMGAVYKARQRGLDRLVAVKILPPEIGDDPAFAERFTREARALARLGHSHIVSVYDFGQAGNLFYIVMEHVDGVNLRQTIQAGGLTPQAALAIVPQICEALQFAHDEGIVHRDIKPENILIDKKGRVKIADFGLAKLLGQDTHDHSLTAAHQVMGTLRYMAPEQMLGSREVDHRADIYSLGVIFYELLTGELPMGKFAPPSKKVQVDVRLDEIVLRALEQDPEQRYQHASEVKTDVETVSHSARPVSFVDAQIRVEASDEQLRPATAGGRRLGSTQMWALLLSLLGVASGFLPWGKVTWWGTVPGIDEPGTAFHWTTQVWYGFRGWQGQASIAIFLTLGLIRLATARSGRPRIWQPLSLLAGGLAVLLLCYLTTPIGRLSEPLLADVFRTDPHIALIIPAALALGLLIVAVIELRVARPERHPAFSSNVVESPSQQARGSAGRPRFSRLAIAGAGWAPFFFIAAIATVIPVVVVLKEGEHVGSQWWQMALAFTLLPLGALAPIGTTILGGIAVGHIRRSGGKIVGLPLAVADVLLFPLLLLDFLIMASIAGIVTAVLFVTYPDGPPGTVAELLPQLLTLAIALPLGAWVDFLIARKVWRSVASEVAGVEPSQPQDSIESPLPSAGSQPRPQSPVTTPKDPRRGRQAALLIVVGLILSAVWLLRNDLFVPTIPVGKGRLIVKTEDSLRNVRVQVKRAGVVVSAVNPEVLNWVDLDPGVYELWIEGSWASRVPARLDVSPSPFTLAAGERQQAKVFLRKFESEDPSRWVTRGRDFDALQGRWAVVSQELGGSPVPPGVGPEWLEFEGDQMRFGLPSASRAVLPQHHFALDPAASPSQINLLGTGSRMLEGPGIYRIDGDALTLCIGESYAIRPSQFKTERGSLFVLTVCRRANASQMRGAVLATGPTTNSPTIDAPRLEELVTLSGHTGWVYTVRFSPDGTRVASASHDGTAKVWDATTGEELFICRGHTNYVHGLAYSPDGTRLATTSEDGSIRIWNANTGEQIFKGTGGHPRGASNLAFSPNGERIASACVDDKIKVWDSKTGEAIFTLESDTSHFYDVAYSRDGKWIAGGAMDGTVWLWDATTGREADVHRQAKIQITAVAFDRGSQRLAALDARGDIRVWGAPSGGLLVHIQPDGDAHLSIAINPDGNWIAGGGMDGTIKLWEVSIGHEVRSIKAHPRLIKSVAFSPDGTRLASGSDDKTVKIWKVIPAGI
jgi:uncharacterized protein (TIGR03067 family)